MCRAEAQGMGSIQVQTHPSKMAGRRASTALGECRTAYTSWLIVSVTIRCGAVRVSATPTPLQVSAWSQRRQPSTAGTRRT